MKSITRPESTQLRSFTLKSKRTTDSPDSFLLRLRTKQLYNRQVTIPIAPLASFFFSDSVFSYHIFDHWFLRFGKFGNRPISLVFSFDFGVAGLIQ